MTPWPIRGLLLFLRHPSWWWRPLVATFLGWALLGVVGVAVAWSCWPAAEVTGLEHWLGVCVALAVACATALLTWAVVLPLLLWFALEDLARQAYRSTGREPQELNLARGFAGSLRVLINTAHWRLVWGVGGLVAGFAGPVGVVIAAVGATHLVSLDAWDLALGLDGRGGLDRLAVMRARRAERFTGVAAGALMLLLLGPTVIGLLLWLPAMVCGAALAVADDTGTPPGSAGFSLHREEAG
jgi:hypothetical protein